jgi:hypothetical protein
MARRRCDDADMTEPIDAVSLDLAALILGSDEPTARRRLWTPV